VGFGVDASSAFGDSRFGEFACDGACFVRCHDDNDGDVSVELNKIRLRGGDFEVVTTKSSALRCVDKNSSNR